ncbi:MAG: hypothetical protein KKH98_02345 [Spirochaetes bacterium]|nr:hypothetical protein [Spirochaetota bacterium]
MSRSLFTLFIILVLVTSSFAYTLFEDSFDDESKITFKTNIIVTNGSVINPNWPSPPNTGYIFSTLVTRTTNEQWEFLISDYQITNSGPFPPPTFPKVTVKIYDQYTNELLSSTEKTIDLSIYNNIKTNTSLLLKAVLNCGFPGNEGTPILDSWKITANEVVRLNITPVHASFYGAPAPLKKDYNDSTIRFYYKIQKNCTVSLKIYDTNYNLIKNISTDKHYSAGDNLNETWDGKNGNNIQVMSGVYIAILKVENSDGSKESLDPFIFAVIR